MKDKEAREDLRILKARFKRLGETLGIDVVHWGFLDKIEVYTFENSPATKKELKEIRRDLDLILSHLNLEKVEVKQHIALRKKNNGKSKSPNSK